jgi:hypothetical protein
MVVQTKSKFKQLYQIYFKSKKNFKSKVKNEKFIFTLGKKIWRCAVINYSRAPIDRVNGVGKPCLVVIMHGSSNWVRHDMLAPTFFYFLFIIYNNFSVVSTPLMKLATI